MARKTKAELTAEREAEQAQRVAVAKATYTERMMAVLERAVKENFELTVKANQFLAVDCDDSRAGWVVVYPVWHETADVALYELEMAVEFKEEARVEREQKAQARATALAKLSKEERELLGL